MVSTLSFSIKSKLHEEYIDKYWSDKVLLVSKARTFFNLFILIPFVLLTICILLLVFFWLYQDINYNSYRRGKFIFISILCISNLGYFIKRYLDYKLDFTIFTPEEIIQYNQEGIFSRPIKIVNANKIKTIIIEKETLSKSLLNYGTLYLLSEWDQQWRGDIEIQFVWNPELVNDQIRWILKHI